MVGGIHLKSRYRVDRYPLSHQGMGEIWPALDTVLDREVIVKTINSSLMDADLARRFQREAQVTARFVHPGVPAVYDYGQHDGHFFLVLQKIKGKDLSELVDENGPLPVSWVAAIGAQISSVLIAARRINLLHRDIKPSNVMLEGSGAIKVLDFGLAAIPGDDRYSRITQSGDSLGTAGYMAPEQIEAGPTDHRTDLYGLGATLFDLLTGSPPFGGPTPTDTMMRQLQTTPPRPAELRPGVPAAVDDLVHQLMSVLPQDRPSSAAVVYRVLAPHAGNLPPIPGVVSNQPDPVRAYAAVVGRVSSPAPREDVDLELSLPDDETRARHLAAAGQVRAAARLWRQMAGRRALLHGNEDATVVEYHINAIRLHAELGERDRAMRQISDLYDRVEAHDPEHPALPDIRREIAKLSEDAPYHPER